MDETELPFGSAPSNTRYPRLRRTRRRDLLPNCRKRNIVLLNLSELFPIVAKSLGSHLLQDSRIKLLDRKTRGRINCLRTLHTYWLKSSRFQLRTRYQCRRGYFRVSVPPICSWCLVYSATKSLQTRMRLFTTLDKNAEYRAITLETWSEALIVSCPHRSHKSPWNLILQAVNHGAEN